MQIASIDGGHLAYADEGAGPAVVLVHGFPLNHTIWDAVAPRLASRARVIRPDLRGLGGSSVTAGPYLMESLAGDVAALLDALGIERAALVGHALGGYVALAFYRMYRERVTALGLVASLPDADDPGTAAGREELAQRLEREGIAPLLDRSAQLFGAATRADDPALVARTTALIGRTDPKGAAALLRGMAMRVDSIDLAEEIDVPFLIVAGSEDRMIDVKAAQDHARAASGRCAIVDGCGHLPMLENPHRIADLLANELLTRA